MLGRCRDEPGKVGEHDCSRCSVSVEQYFCGPLHSTLLPLQLVTLTSLVLIRYVLHSMTSSCLLDLGDSSLQPAWLHQIRWKLPGRVIFLDTSMSVLLGTAKVALHRHASHVH